MLIRLKLMLPLGALVIAHLGALVIARLGVLVIAHLGALVPTQCLFSTTAPVPAMLPVPAAWLLCDAS